MNGVHLVPQNILKQNTSEFKQIDNCWVIFKIKIKFSKIIILKILKQICQGWIEVKFEYNL